MGIKVNGWIVALFVAIPLIPILIFWVIPTIIALWLSFTNWDYISPTFDYVGFDNYTDLLTSSTFIQALWQTIVLAFFTVVPTIIIGFIIAMLLSRLSKTSNFLRNMIFSPYITPAVAMSIVFTWIFNPEVGPIRHFFTAFGYEAPNWSTTQPWAMILIIIVTIWQTVGYASIFYADAIARIPNDLLEVADIEGVSMWQRIRHIYIPLVSPTTVMLVIMQIISALQAYETIDILTQGGPSGSTRTLLYYYYELGFERFDMGEATALAIIILLITLVLSSIIFRINRKQQV